jgi:hypothetical protein
VLPAFDHHAAEYNPFHSHEVVGTASPAQRQQLLVNHQHGAGQPHQHPSEPAPRAVPPGPTVVSLGALDGVLALVAPAADLVASEPWRLLLAPLAVWVVVGAAALLLLPRSALPRKQPPRFN